MKKKMGKIDKKTMKKINEVHGIEHEIPNRTDKNSIVSWTEEKK